jgi:hypothetical protein
LNFLLCCRYCQAPFTHFFLLSILPLKAYLLGNTCIAQMFTSAHMSMYGGLPGAAQVRYDPCHHPGFNTRCFRSHSPDHSGGFLWRGDLASPTTFYPCGRKRPSPDSLGVFRREPAVLAEATPSLRRRASHARKCNGPPPPASGSRGDSAPQHRFHCFEHRPLGYHPGLEEAPERHE